jgi:hypothetical protein
MHAAGEPLSDVGIACGEVPGFGRVRGEVVELRAGSVGVDEKLPPAGSNGQVGAAVAAGGILETLVVAPVFPQQRLGALGRRAQERGAEVFAVARRAVG